MNNLLLDTHALLWWLFDDSRLSAAARAAIAAPECRVWVSAAWAERTSNKVPTPDSYLRLAMRRPSSAMAIVFFWVSSDFRAWSNRS